MLSTFKRHPVLATAFAVSVLMLIAFSGSFIWRLAYWQMHAREEVQAWMTVGYVGHSWGIKPALIDEQAGLPLPEKGHPYTLQEIADQRGVPVEDIIARVNEAVAAIRSHQGIDQP